MLAKFAWSTFFLPAPCLRVLDCVAAGGILLAPENTLCLQQVLQAVCGGQLPHFSGHAQQICLPVSLTWTTVCWSSQEAGCAHPQREVSKVINFCIFSSVLWTYRWRGKYLAIDRRPERSRPKEAAELWKITGSKQGDWGIYGTRSVGELVE